MLDEQRRVLDATNLVMELVSDLADQEWETFELSAYWAHGGEQFRHRVERVADWCASKYPGDLVEIGAYTGGTSARLAKVAERYGRRLLVVDPWITGQQECAADTYEIFLKNIEPWKDRVDVLRVGSESAKAIERMAGMNLCFAFIDGLHNEIAVKRDIDSVSHCNGIISVDDIIYDAKLRSAFVLKAREGNRVPVHYILCREGYLV